MPLSKIQTNSISSTANATFQNVVATRIGIGVAANTSYGLLNRYGGNSELATQYGTGTLSGIGAYATEGSVFVETAGSARKYPIAWKSDTGYVNMPLQPAFNAFGKTGGDGDATYSAGQFVVFTSTRYNVGNAYSTATSRFTCPIAGMYLFWFVCYNQTSIQGLRVRLINETQSLALGQIQANTGVDWHQSSLMKCNAGDVIGVSAAYNNTTIFHAAAHNEFGGMLIG
jgi:hypothetical protein